ncbi:MAG: pantoate--beta-alanine ligase [Rhodothermales bacterium]
MDLFTKRTSMQAAADAWRAAGKTIALVPTMGALHAGHLKLVEQAREHADVVIVSIFVNPTQFAPGEDYDRYPRTLHADQALLEPLGVDAVFAPSALDMYPFGVEEVHTYVQVEKLSERLCGATRVGHFTGVTTVVAKLFLASKPHKAVFGLKDAQQFFVLKRMVTELGFDVELIGVPTVREPSGLALSSRNAYLTDDERKETSVIASSLQSTAKAVADGELDLEALVGRLAQRITQAGGTVQYAEAVETRLLTPVTTAQPGQSLLIAVAVFWGTTRLIDNVLVTVPDSAQPVR